MVGTVSRRHQRFDIRPCLVVLRIAVGKLSAQQRAVNFIGIADNGPNCVLSGGNRAACRKSYGSSTGNCHLADTGGNGKRLSVKCLPIDLCLLEHVFNKNM